MHRAHTFIRERIFICVGDSVAADAAHSSELPAGPCLRASAAPLLRGLPAVRGGCCSTMGTDIAAGISLADGAAGSALAVSPRLCLQSSCSGAADAPNSSRCRTVRGTARSAVAACSLGVRTEPAGCSPLADGFTPLS